MNEYDLYDAFGGIDNELLERTEHKAVRKFPVRKLLIAAAAVMMMVVTVVAAPKLKELLFGSEIELHHKGIMYVDNENSISFSVDSAYEVDMILPCAETAPLSIEEYRLPTYFTEKGWNCDSSFVYPDIEHIGARYLFSIPDEPQFWVIFDQSPFSLLEPRGRSQFLMDGGRTGSVVEHSISIGDVEGVLYVVEPSKADGEPGQKNLVWSDGEYAYLMECSWAVNDEMIAGIVLSLAQVEDITPYLTEPEPEIPEKQVIPIDTFYTLLPVPDGFALAKRHWDADYAIQHWQKNEEVSIELHQERNITTEHIGTSLDITSALAEVMTGLDPYTYETANSNGQLYHIIYHQGNTFAMWETEDYIFHLTFNGQKLTTQEMLTHLQNVQPMPDFTDHLTE